MWLVSRFRGKRMRTSGSGHECRRFEVPAPPAANSCGNFKSKSGTRTIDLLVPLCFRSSCQRGPPCITNFGSGALDRVQRSRARVGTAVENVLDVVEQAIANRIVPAVRRIEAVPFVIPDHRSPDNDVILAGEEVGDRSIFATATEEVLQPGGIPEDDEMAATGLERLIIEQLFCSVPGAVDDDVFFQVLDLLPVLELPGPEPDAALLEIGNQFRQQNAGIDQPCAVFASNLVRAPKRKLAAFEGRHNVTRRALVERGIRAIERIVFPLRDAILAPTTRILDVPDPGGRSPQVVLKNRQVRLLIFVANLRWRELACGDERGGLGDVEGLRIDRDRQRGPFAPQLD